MSNRRLTTSTLALVLGASLAALAAQAPSRTPQTAGSTAAATDAITVQGCVQPSVNAVSATPDAVAVGTSGSVSTATAYILVSGVKPTGTSGSGTSASAPIAPTYQLAAEGHINSLRKTAN
jgi:hypothetical protein